MIAITRTNSKNKDFLKLVHLLDAELALRDGEDHGFYDQYNGVDHIKYVVLAYENGIPVACGAMKKNAPNTIEIKRMYVIPNSRVKGLATKILSALEGWAMELDFERCILETGKRQLEAVQLYQKNGYERIPNYGQYAVIDNSLCFKKELIHN